MRETNLQCGSSPDRVHLNDSFCYSFVPEYETKIVLATLSSSGCHIKISQQGHSSWHSPASYAALRGAAILPFRNGIGPANVFTAVFPLLMS